MNVNAAKCRITANSYGPPISEEVAINSNLSEYNRIIHSFSDILEEERKTRSRRYSYNTYHPSDASSHEKQNMDFPLANKGWPENNIPWGRHTIDRINDEMIRQGRVNIGNKKIDGRPQSSPGSSRRPYKYKNGTHDTGRRHAVQTVRRSDTVRLMYKRPPAPEPPVHISTQSSLNTTVPQSLIIVLGKTTPTTSKEQSNAINKDSNGTKRETTSTKLPSYYLGQLNAPCPNHGSSYQDSWSSSHQTKSINNNECDNCGGYTRIGVGF